MTVHSSHSPPAEKAEPHVLSASGQRSYPRMSMPLTVVIGGETYEAMDWSLGGFGLESKGPAADAGDIVSVEMILRFTHFDTRMLLSAKAVRVVDGVGLGFRFIDVSTEKAAVLNYIADNYLAGELGSVSGMMEAGGQPGKIAFTEQGVVMARRTHAFLRYAGILGVSLAVIAFGLFSIVSTFLTVRSEYAAVASSLDVVRAPENGFMAAPERAVGDRVKRGEVLFQVMPTAKPQGIEVLEQAIAVLEGRRLTKESALKQSVQAFEGHQNRISSELQTIQQRQKSLKSAVEAQARVYERMRSLAQSGNVSKTTLDREEIALREKERLYAEGQAEEIRLQQDLDHADNGMYVSDGRSTQETPDDIRRALTEIETEIQARKTALDDMQKSLVVRSPCDCTIETAAARDKEFLERGTLVYRLSAANPLIEVDVLVPSGKARLLRVGQEAQILLSDQANKQVGVITALSLNPQNNGRSGLPDNLRQLGRFALATVRLKPGSEAQSPPPIGLPVVATFRIEIGALFYYMTGLTWFLADTPRHVLTKIDLQNS